MRFEIYDTIGNKMVLKDEESYLMISVNATHSLQLSFQEFKNLYVNIYAAFAAKEYKKIFFDSFVAEVDSSFLQKVSLHFYEDFGYEYMKDIPVLLIEMNRGAFIDFCKIVSKIFHHIGYGDSDEWIVVF